MTSRTSKRPKNATREPSLGATAFLTRGRPLTKLRTIEDTAELLSVSPRTVQRLIKSGVLQVHRFGRLVRIADGDIALLLAMNRSL
jgi:excisionase family DNA binding protein